MSRRYVYVSQELETYAHLFLETASQEFTELHAVTFTSNDHPSWVYSIPNLKVHNLLRPSMAYDDPDETRYPRLRHRLRLDLQLTYYARRLRRLLHSIDATILQGMWIPTDGYICARSGFHPLVIAPFVTDVVRKSEVSGRLRKRIEWTLQQADKVFADCLWLKEEIQQRFPTVPADKIIVFPRGIELSIFHPPGAQAVHEPPVILCNRAFEDIYDHETLFQALDKIGDRRYRLLLVGEGSLKNTFKERASKSRWHDRIELRATVEREEMAQIYRSSSIYVSTALQDGSSASLMEAMASGLPCVATDLPSNREWIETERSGYLFPSRNGEALAENLSKLLDHPELRRTIGREAYAVAKKKADWTAHRKTVLHTYQELIDGA